MSIVSVTEVSLLGDNPCKISDKLSFEIQFEALKKLKDDLEWAMVYVADANDSSKDQELDTVELGPVEVATMKFTFEVWSALEILPPARSLSFDTAVPLDKGVEVEVTDDEDEPDNDEVECNEPDEAPVDNLEQMETSEETEAAQDMKVDPVGQSKIDPVAPSESIAMDVDVAGG
ncbi:anti-silencing protein, putative [Perkinsus marinus ATCC 50983]|uniref:Anti-silencing protein, putative n=1 Tax=Perkinsus marinus (strain ATCC 50983 / TXsc) TaxID=423536 RepID=C5LDW8_PERM5|nr:anti-silencing protein, putative [Perkinsus marinus ATCC 50983]EER05132.1 anti-silencing protein, putative [Perkinsus marinus ATCC 50983]|eukprot:XP_002773316.1 anti-silencing protein, putative [Perkinsus marinus ATCC 50983]